MHFPNSTDSAFCSYIAIGPMCRYASDLKPMLKVMSADEGKCLELDKKVCGLFILRCFINIYLNVNIYRLILVK